LVDDKQIETTLTRWKELSYRQRAHKEYWLQPLDRRRRIGNELANRAMPPFLLNLSSDDSHFSDLAAVWTLVEIARYHLMASRSSAVLIQLAEFGSLLAANFPINRCDFGGVRGRPPPKRFGYEKLSY